MTEYQELVEGWKKLEANAVQRERHGRIICDRDLTMKWPHIDANTKALALRGARKKVYNRIEDMIVLEQIRAFKAALDNVPYGPHE